MLLQPVQQVPRNIDAPQVATPILPLTNDWPYVVTCRDNCGVVRESGFLSLALACDYAKYMDRRPSPIPRNVVLFDRARKARFIPVGDGFRKYTPASVRRKAAAGQT